MRMLKNHDTEVMNYTGNIEGFRILVKKVGEGIAIPKFKNVILDWRVNGDIKYAGDLATFVQALFFRANDTTKRMALLSEPGIKVNENLRISDLSVLFPAYAGAHELTIRMNDCFDDEQSVILFDFDKSDDVCTETFKLVAEPITIAGDKAKQIEGNVSLLLFMQSDNQFIESNDGAFAGESEHPVSNCSINSAYAQSNYSGEELQVLEVADMNGFLKQQDGIVSKLLQKSIRLSDREIMVNPEVNLKLRPSSMTKDVQYNLVYDVVTLLK